MTTPPDKGSTERGSSVPDAPGACRRASVEGAGRGSQKDLPVEMTPDHSPNNIIIVSLSELSAYKHCLIYPQNPSTKELLLLFYE